MKKLVTLALAGICALAFAAVADAGTAVRMKDSTVKQGVTKTVGSGSVQVNRVETGYSIYAINDGTRDSQGGYFVVNSIWTDNLLNSQTVYDDVKASLNKIDSQFSQLFPAVAQEATYVHAAQISSGNARYNMTTQAAGTGYSSVYNIAHYVIPGRVASLAQGTTEIDMSTENAPTNAPAATNTNAKTFENPEAAAKWVDEVRKAFNDQEADNARGVASKVSDLSTIYNKFLADQKTVLDAAQDKYDKAVKARQDAEKDYKDAIADTQAKQADYNAKKDLSKVQTAYANAISAREVAETALTNAKSAESSAKTALDKAKSAESSAKTALANAKEETATAQAAYDAAVKANNNFDYGMREEALADALDTAGEEYSDAQYALEEAVEAQTEANKEVASIQDKIDVASQYMSLWNAYAGVRNSHLNSGETGIEQLEAVREKAEAVRAFEDAHGLAHSYMLIDGSSHNVSIIMYGNDRPSSTYSYPSQSSNTAPFLGNPDTSSLENQLSSANSAVTKANSAVTKATKAEETAYKAYQSAQAAYTRGVNALKDEQAALQQAVKDTKATLEAKQAAQETAQSNYDSKVSARKTAQSNYDSKVSARQAKETALAEAKTVEANAKTAKENAEQAKTNAEKALADAKTAEAKAKTAKDNAVSAESSALTALKALKQQQDRDNAEKLAQLKSQLTSYINGLKYIDDQTGIYGLSYNVNMINGYDDLRFDEVHYVANSFTEPEYSISSSNKKDDKAIESIVSVSYRQQPYAMVDGALQQVSYVDTNLYETSIYYQSGQKYISPLVLDITGNGTLQASNGQNMPGHDVVASNNIIGDFFGDGFEIAMEWVGPQDGLLVAPKADGSVDMSCLFGTAGGYENGYEKLSLYDKNNDMKVTGEELNDLAIWQDANGNGIADAGEVKSVKSLGITSINVAFDRTNYVSSFERNGQTYKMWDWWPNAVELIKVAAK